MDINYINVGTNNFSELDVQYMPSLWSKGEFSVKRRMSVLHRYSQILEDCSDSARRHVPCQLQIPYGKSEKQKFDLFGVDCLPETAPLLIFVHGGYWVEGSRESAAWFVETFYEAGICVAVAGYELAPKANLDEIVFQVRRAVTTIRDHVKPRRKIYLAGHSVGAQLVASALLQDSNDKEILTVEGLILLSGVYKLEPLADTSVQADTKFDRAMLERNSPANISPEVIGYRCHERSPRGIFLACGDWEPPKFKEETWNFNKLLEDANVPVYHTVVLKRDHFSVVEDLRLKDYKLTQEIIAFIKTGSLPSLP